MRNTTAFLCIAGFLLAGSHLHAEPPVSTSEKTISFDGETYALRFKNRNRIEVLNEYIRDSETLKTWTKLIAVRHYPQLTHHTKSVALLAKMLKLQNPDARYAIWTNENETETCIDFLTWQGDEFAEFNVFIYGDSPDGKGLIARQFTMRAYGEEMVPFMRSLKEHRPKIISNAWKFNFPAIVER